VLACFSVLPCPTVVLGLRAMFRNYVVILTIARLLWTCVTKMEFCMRHAKDKMIVEVLFRWIYQTTHSSEWLKILVWY
jgi:hypothetical protein